MTAVKVRQEGFTELSEGGPEPIADLVFVHGLQGHPERTWTYGKMEKESKLAKPKNRLSRLFARKSHAEDHSDEPACSATGTPPLFWPHELLSKDCPNARVLTYGYDSQISNFFKGPANQSGILAHGVSLMRALEVERRKCRKRPIIFLVHSLGGLILKQALSRSKTAMADQHGLRDIYESTHAIIFFGTPHRGSSYAKMGGLARDIAVIAGFDARDTILRSLEPDAEILTILGDEFARMLLDGSFKVHSFQEGMGFTGAHFLSRKIVDNESSRLGDARETTDFINANHMMMCRFRDPHDPGYRKVKGVVTQYLDEIQSAQAREDEQKQRLLSENVAREKGRLELERSNLIREIRTSLRAAQINERVGEVETAHDHTFDWAFSPSETGFPEWLQGNDGLFWITGKPGSGKSTLMKYLHQDDRTKEALAHNGRKILAMPEFYFHARGAESEKSFDGLLRSLFYQLLSEVPELVDSVAGIYNEFKEQGLPCPWSLRQLRTAMDNLRRQQVEGCICVFIDALDEYSGPREDIADFVKRLASPVDEGGVAKLKLRVCASSRPETAFVSKLKGIPSFAIHNWTQTDIMQYASDRLAECDRPGTNIILDDITSKADGVFLWVKLVLDELWQPLCNGMPVEEARTKLSELPTGLPAFYERMVRQIHEDDKPVLMAMLELVLCFDYNNLKPGILLKYFCLGIDVMQRKDLATPQDIHLTPAEDERRRREVERRIKACSGGLLEISSTGRVQFVHQTAKSFVQDAHDLGIFDGKSTRTMALAGMERMMRLFILLVKKMDSAENWIGSLDYSGFLAPTCPERYPHFATSVVVEFLGWALLSECAFETTCVELIHDFDKAMVTSCGQSWRDTWWSTVEWEGNIVRPTNDWVRGNVKPASLLEFAMQTELFMFVEIELEKNIPTNPDITRNPKLLFYTLIGNALSRWEGSLFLYHSPKSWLDFARFLIGKGFSVNAVWEMDTRSGQLELMSACREERPEFWTREENNRGTELVQHGGRDSTDSTEGIVSESEGYESDEQATCLHRVSILHLALAIACCRVRVERWYYQTVYRLDMLRVLVEAGGNAGTSNYRNHWSDESFIIERSAVHYLLSSRFETDNSSHDNASDGNTEVSNALHKCIIAFLDHGADPNAVDSIGISVLELAVAWHPYDLVQALLEKGARVTPSLLSASGEPTDKADGILKELRWRRPECYTPEARRIAVGYNPHWGVLEEEERQGSEVQQPQEETDGGLLGGVGLHVGNLVGSVKDWTWKRIANGRTN